MSLRGRVLYPEMRQKAAVLMETLCKSHTPTDGNKRASVMAAEYLASINGATLVVPLKAARMAVDCAMDADDSMSEEIAARFKTHITRDGSELAVMLVGLVDGLGMVAARSAPSTCNRPRPSAPPPCKPLDDRQMPSGLVDMAATRPAVKSLAKSPPPAGTCTVHQTSRSTHVAHHHRVYYETRFTGGMVSEESSAGMYTDDEIRRWAPLDPLDRDRMTPKQKRMIVEKMLRRNAVVYNRLAEL